MATMACGFTYEFLLRPSVGVRPCSGAAWLGVVCVLLSGAGPPGLLLGRSRAALCRCLVRGSAGF